MQVEKIERGKARQRQAKPSKAQDNTQGPKNACIRVPLQRKTTTQKTTKMTATITSQNTDAKGTRTLLLRQRPLHTRPKLPSPIILCRMISLGLMMLRLCPFIRCRARMALSNLTRNSASAPDMRPCGPARVVREIPFRPCNGVENAEVSMQRE